MNHLLGIAALTLVCAGSFPVSSQAGMAITGSPQVSAPAAGDLRLIGWDGSKKSRSGFGGLDNLHKHGWGESGSHDGGKHKGNKWSDDGSGSKNKSGWGGKHKGDWDKVGGGKHKGNSDQASGGGKSSPNSTTGGKASDNVLWGDYEQSGKGSGTGAKSTGGGSTGGSKTNDDVLWGDYR